MAALHGTDKLKMSTVVPASPKQVYEAWITGREHAAFTGSKATVDAKVGGRHMAHDGYIYGWNLVLEPGKRIVQSWRTTEFQPENPDSVLELRLAKAGGGTKITLVHTDIPAGQGERYEQGWRDYYFAPMAQYFEKKAPKRKK